MIQETSVDSKRTSLGFDSKSLTSKKVTTEQVEIEQED